MCLFKFIKFLISCLKNSKFCADLRGSLFEQSCTCEEVRSIFWSHDACLDNICSSTVQFDRKIIYTEFSAFLRKASLKT